jgi:murein DD-endopeptidase MepM/ murein hydrolase activator NlpD
MGRKRRRSFWQNPNVQGMFVILVVGAVATVVLLQNRQPAHQFAKPITAIPTQQQEPEWRGALENQLENAATAEPTLDVPTSNFVPPTIPVDPNATLQILQVTQIQPNVFASDTPVTEGLATVEVATQQVFQEATVPFARSSPVPSPTGIVEGSLDEAAISELFQPPPEQVPLIRQPNDHFVFQRPVNARGNSQSLFYYPYGSQGLVSRVHHGIDIVNPKGQPVQAAQDGVVVYAGSTLQDIRVDDFEVYASYGQVVVVKHDFSYEGEDLFTLYAHLSWIEVEEGERVEMGDVVGLVGDTGYVTGAHVHFEVRIGTNSYANTYNPLLWMVPFLNHGVIAGRVIDSDGQFINNVTLQINRGGRRIDSTVTYADPTGILIGRFHVNPDPKWGENFVFGDVEEGQYQIVALVNGRRFEDTITVEWGMVNWIEFQVDPPESTPLPPNATQLSDES